MNESEAIKLLKKANRDNDMVGILPKSDIGKCLIKALEEIQQYRVIGTVEECRAAVEKAKAKLVIDNTPTEDSVWYQCPTCKGDLTTIRGFCCGYCGQKLEMSKTH